MSRTITIIGHFGGNKHLTDGQTVKTQNLYKELKKYTDWNIIKVDTFYNKSNPIKLGIDTLVGIIKSKDIIILLSGNGMKVYFPLLSFIAVHFGKRVYHDVIGGNLSEYVKKYPKYQKYLNSFRKNWVETNLLKKELDYCGVRNADVIPNFRCFYAVNKNELKADFQAPYKFCTFSRVVKEKGIEEAIDAIISINKKANFMFCKLDIYGPVDPDYEERFSSVIQNSTEAVVYKGVVDTGKAIEVLKPYYGVLFPTHWEGEGNAGTISESFIAGVPVLATDWRCNGEMIKNGYNGIIYPSDEAKTLADAIYWLINQKSKILEIKANCLTSAEYYRPDQNIKKIVRTIEENA